MKKLIKTSISTILVIVIVISLGLPVLAASGPTVTNVIAKKTALAKGEKTTVAVTVATAPKSTLTAVVLLWVGKDLDNYGMSLETIESSGVCTVPVDLEEDMLSTTKTAQLVGIVTLDNLSVGTMYVDYNFFGSAALGLTEEMLKEQIEGLDGYTVKTAAMLPSWKIKLTVGGGTSTTTTEGTAKTKPTSPSVPATPVTPVTPATPKTTTTTKDTGVKAATVTLASQIDAAVVAAKNGIATAKTVNQETITKDELASYVTKAKGVTPRLHMDTVLDKKIAVRIAVDASKVTAPIATEAWTNSAAAEKVKARFAKYYANNMTTIAFAQKTSLGTTAEIMLPWAKDNGENLVFYRYSPDTNKYETLTVTDYFVDNNGFLHFTADPYAVIIISTGAFSK